MQSRLEIRRTMLDTMKASLEAADETYALKVVFKEGATILCQVPFDHLEVGDEGTLAIAVFKNSLDEDTLAAPAEADGVVDSFEIYGKDPPYAALQDDELVLQGSAGSIGSGADIQFTRTEWTTDTNVRLTRLRVVLR